MCWKKVLALLFWLGSSRAEDVPTLVPEQVVTLVAMLVTRDPFLSPLLLFPAKGQHERSRPAAPADGGDEEAQQILGKVQRGDARYSARRGWRFTLQWASPFNSSSPCKEHCHGCCFPVY